MSTQSEEPRTSEPGRNIDYMTDTRPIAAGETAPGCKKRDPIVVAENVTRSFGGINAVDVEYLEIPRHKITALIGPNGAGKTTLFNLLTGFDTPNSGKWQFEGNSLAGVSSYKVARMGMVRTFQLTKVMGKLTVMENMRLGGLPPVRRAALQGPVQGHLGRPGKEDHRGSQRPAGEVQAGRQEGRLRGVPLRRPAQAARNGPLADGPAQAGHARRADGRRQPGPDAVAAGPHQEPQGRGHDRPVRRTRHAHGPAHRRLGRGHGRGQDRRRGPARRGHEEPCRDRRLPGRPPRRGPR